MNLVCDQDLVAEVWARYEVSSIIVVGKQCNGTISTCDLCCDTENEFRELVTWKKKFVD